MAYDIEVRRIERADTAVIRRTVPVEQIGATLGEVFPAVFTYLQRSGVEPGAAFARYLSMGAGSFEVEAGAVVSRPVEGEGEIVAAELPAGEVAVTMHTGPYEKLSEAYAALQAWMAAHARDPAGPMWESYLTDPEQEPDPAKWRTEVFWPVA